MDNGWFAHFQFFVGTFFGLELCSILALLVGPYGPFFAWTCSLLHEILEFGYVHMLPWAFIPYGLLLVNIFGFFHKYLQWAFGQLVVIFKTIEQVSKYFCK